MPDVTEKRKIGLSVNEALLRAQQQMKELDPSAPDDEELEDDEVVDETELRTAPPGETEEPTSDAPAVAAPAQAAVPATKTDAPATTTTADGQPAAPPDPWAETVDVEYVDGDKKYVVRAPKSYAEEVKKGYSRRQLMDRALGSLGKNKAFIENLAASGQLDQIVPYLQAFTSDRELADAAAEILARRQTGRPIRFADEAAAAATQAQIEELKMPDLSEYDEYTAGAIKNAVTPFMQVLNEMRREQAKTTTQQTQAQQQAEAARAQQAQLAQLGTQVRFELQRRFSNVFAEDVVPYQRLQQYVESNGYINTYGLSPAAWLIAAQDMLANGELQPPALPTTTAQSTAAAVIRETEQTATALARGARASVAAAVSPGTAGAASTAPPAKRPLPRTVKMANGKTRPITPKELADYMAKTGRAS